MDKEQLILEIEELEERIAPSCVNGELPPAALATSKTPIPPTAAAATSTPMRLAGLSECR